jgi:phytoene synthase
MSRRELDAAGITDPLLRESYLHCRELHARHGRTYYLATKLLPPERRPYVWALYGFARFADEIVDDLADSSAPAERSQRLAGWSEQRLAELERGSSTDPIGRALVHTAAVWALPPVHFEAFLTSMRRDLTVREYPTFRDLQGYMHGSAAVIGLQMLPILGPLDPRAAEHAQALGIAFQLSNFVRDVGEDLARGRLYLPLEDLAAHGVTRADLQRGLENGIATEAVRELMRFQVARARQWYDKARPGIELLHPSSRECIAVALRLYAGILDEVEGSGHQIFARRAAVPTATRVRVGVQAYARARRTWRRSAALTAPTPSAAGI